ncbi:TolB family protein [Nonomuraea sp. ZG12]|uniref:TolB family protein n=1 Tax=Nonomuraea sp. ZG12 TaxID=3452207 RepID=UPI003F89A244
MRTEDDLVAALREGADDAPMPDLIAGVERLKRRRGRRRTQLLAAAAVITVASTSMAVALRGGQVAPVQPAVTTSASVVSPSAAATSAPPQVEVPTVRAADIWPDALFTMPAKNADGWRYRPITALSATEVLLSAESSFERAGRFEIYDSSSGKARVVTEVPKNPDLRGYITQTATVDGRNMVWFSFGRQADGTPVRDIWTAPLAGGQARLVTTRTGPDASIDAIAVNGDRVVWSLVQGGVWEVPLAGGTPSRLPGGDGLHLIRWPWAGDAGTGPGAQKRVQTKVVDLTNGYVSEVVAQEGVTDLRCAPFWCFGRSTNGGFVQRIDGTDPLESRKISHGGALRPYPILDRFLWMGSSVYDMQAGRLATIDNPGNWYGAGTSSEPSTILYWGASKGDKPDKFRVLNLAAVPPAQ